jgi:hypothetical protein
MPARTKTAPALLVALTALIALIATGCGSSSSSSDVANRPAPAAADFPAVKGRTLVKLYAQEGTPDNKLVAAPAGKVYDVGRDRFGFGLFTASGDQVTDADVAIYAAHSPNTPALGPYPARVETLHTDPAFEAKTTADDPDAAKAVYVTDLNLDKPGEWRLFAVVKEGNALHTTIIPSLIAGDSSRIPDVGDRAPVVHTPTTDDVGDVGQIDTRVPHDTMHNTDLADVLGKEPVVLLFATPALCQSRVCGPVVDVAEQVKSDFSGQGVDFIHMEIYKNNNPNEGYRPQLRAYGLRTEPWLFVIDRTGHISTRIEGAFGVDELEHAVRKVTD